MNQKEKIKLFKETFDEEIDNYISTLNHKENMYMRASRDSIAKNWKDKEGYTYWIVAVSNARMDFINTFLNFDNPHYDFLINHIEWENVLQDVAMKYNQIEMKAHIQYTKKHKK